MGKLTIEIECDTGKVSDGYHTFDELYEHRCVLFIALMLVHKDIAWRAEKHEDGSGYAGWFIAGMELPTGQVTYHLPSRMWPLLDGIKTMEKALKWDGHNSQDVVNRIVAWFVAGQPPARKG